MYRLELELKAKSGELPADLIDNRDQYFAGAYPYLQHVLHDVVPEIMVIDRKLAPRLTLERALEHIREQYGSTLFTALTVHQGDIGAVWSKVCGRTHNDALLRAGALLVDPE
jgi:DNA relaxase NicK